MKVGDYVRTKYGITQFKEYETTNGEKLLCMPVKDGSQGIFANIEDVVKSNPNIIGLIEVGDLIRIEYYSLRYEERVTRLFEVTFKDKKYINLNNSKCDFMLIGGDFNKRDKELEPIIKSIVTKEQFSCMEYKIGE